MERNERRRLRRRAHRITERLHEEYGSPEHGNKSDPLDEVIYIVLSQMTTGPSYQRVFDRLEESVGSRWEALPQLPMRQLRRLIRDAGLSRQKAPRLKQIVRQVVRDYGRASLEELRDLGDVEVEEYLVSLPGIGKKTAKCVMMYSLGRAVLPVDTHVWRVARRTGLVQPEVSYPRVHEALEEAVSPRDRHSFHVNALSHGQEVCIATGNPRCHACVLSRSCPSARR